MTHTIGMISLGCAKNQVNAEHMLWLLRQAGYEISPDPDGAELVIVNTCGFIESAKTEAIDNILAMAQLKAEGRIQKILVTGCLAQRYQEEILKELPEVDGVLGTGSYYDVANAVGQVLSGKRYKRFDDINADQSEDGRILTTPEYYAYLKIAEGCDNHCAYCVIPKLRGKLRSRPMEDLIKEAEQLASDGVKELIVVAQDTSRYGLDLYGERKLAELLRRLCKIDGLVWVRVHYLYPDEMSQELIDVLANEPKIVKYLDIPIQHINDEILRKMNRRGNGEYVRQLFTKLRHEIPGLVLRTSLITGLPGEGEVEFAQLCDFLKEYKLERSRLAAEGWVIQGALGGVDLPMARSILLEDQPEAVPGAVLGEARTPFDELTWRLVRETDGTLRLAAHMQAPGLEGRFSGNGSALPASLHADFLFDADAKLSALPMAADVTVEPNGSARWSLDWSNALERVRDETGDVPFSFEHLKRNVERSVRDFWNGIEWPDWTLPKMPWASPSEDTL